MKWLSGFIQLDNNSCPIKLRMQSKKCFDQKCFDMCKQTGPTMIQVCFLIRNLPISLIFRDILAMSCTISQNSFLYLPHDFTWNFLFPPFFFPSSPRQKLWEIRKTAHREARLGSDMNSSSPCGAEHPRAAPEAERILRDAKREVHRQSMSSR